MKTSTGPQFRSTGGDPRLLIVSARVLVTFFGRTETQKTSDFFKDAGVPEGSRKARKGFAEALPEGDFYEHSDVRVFFNPHIYIYIYVIFPQTVLARKGFLLAM